MDKRECFYIRVTMATLTKKGLISRIKQWYKQHICVHNWKPYYVEPYGIAHQCIKCGKIRHL